MTRSEPPITADVTESADVTDVSEAESPITAESLIEEVSIDGMCGVY